MICIKDDGELTIQGRRCVVRAQLAALIYDMLEERMFSEDEMKEIFEVALLSREEIDSQIEEKRKKCAELFGEDVVNRIEKEVIEMVRKEVEE